MRSTVAALLLALAACGPKPCQELGERVCTCSGLSSATCKTQVENQLKNVSADDSLCDTLLGSCHEPPGAVFCEWLRTEAGKTACGLAEPAPAQ